MTDAYRPGQRWISTSEPELGLGEVRAVGARTVRVVFAAAGETRDYALQNAPLRRAAFRAGDTIRTTDNRELVVQAVAERGGLLYYRTGQGELGETALSHTLSFGSPIERLFAGTFDPPSLFDLRLSALHHEHRRRQSPVRGLLGGRIDLLPHQIGIASEVTSRLLPRVLLADEVGLGKTIEACLVLHRLLLTGRAQRVLIVVQESLIHQWFVELLRRFTLWFHIYDEARCQAVEAQTPEANPFLEQQLILCDIGLLTRTDRRLAQAIDAGWDLLIVDEAHHLAWELDAVSAEYRAIEAIGRPTPGLLLLTATPEQLGVAGHFARLRLLDPNRFHDLDEFVREMDGYRTVARIGQRLRDGGVLTDDETATLATLVGAPEMDVRLQLSAGAGRDAMLNRLMDQHGPGRVIFRNTRNTVAGFQTRLAHLYPLTIDAGDQPRRKAFAREWAGDVDPGAEAPRFALAQDPRLPWLVDLLRSVAPDKVLLICRTMAKATAIEAALRQQSQLKAAAFHEGLTLVQRDRAAAWFAEPDGARLLICSEIGSEGRNFQFAHHLVLFDLPLDPAVLEQRIGRLDRIGQTRDIHVHVPFVHSTHLEVLARWYHEGLNAFADRVSGGRELRERFEPRLRALATASGATRARLDAGLPALIADARQARAEIGAKLEAGRDRLLEWHSFRPDTAAAIISAIRREDDDRTLEAFMLAVLDLYMIEVEELAPRTYRLGSAGVLVDDFPGLTSDRLTATCDRARALAREDMQFLTWDHPLATGALDLLFGSEHGNCSFGRWVDQAVQELYLEAVYVLECVAPPRIHADRFLPPTPLRVLVDRRGADVSQQLPAAAVAAPLKKGDGGRALITNARVREELLPRLLDRSRAIAQARTTTLIASAQQAARDQLDGEITRLRELRAINRSVRGEEIDALIDQRHALDEHLAQARLRLDAVRVVHRGSI